MLYYPPTRHLDASDADLDPSLAAANRIGLTTDVRRVVYTEVVGHYPRRVRSPLTCNEGLADKTC